VLCSEAPSAAAADLDVLRELAGTGVAVQLIDTDGSPVTSTLT
jgi:hypothetical protein